VVGSRRAEVTLRPEGAAAAVGEPRPSYRGAALGLLMWPRSRSLWNTVARGERRGLYIGLGVVGFLFWCGIFAAVYFLVGKAWAYDQIGVVIARRILEMFLASLFVLLSFSNVITALSTYFLSEDLELVLSLPVSRTTFHYARFLDTITQSSWMMLLFGVPVFLAYGIQSGAGPTYYVALLTAVPALLVIAANLGITVATLLVNVFPARRTRELMVLLGILAVAALFVVVRSLRPERLVNAQEFDNVAQYLAQLDAPAPVLFPPRWASEVLGATLTYSPFPWMEAALLLTCALASAGIARWTTAWGFDGGWARAQEARAARFYRSPVFDRLVLVLPVAWRPIVAKELRVFVRDPAQWSQVFLLSGICAIYLVSIYFLPFTSLQGPALVFMKEAMSFVNVGMGGFVMAAIATRFQYGAVSREGRAWWITRGAPVVPVTWLRAKGVLGSVPMVVVGEVVVVGSGIMLEARWELLVFEAVVTLALAHAISGLALAMGAIWPDLKADSAARAATGPGAVFFMVVALVLNFSVLTLLAVAVWLSVSGRSVTGGVTLGAVALGVCLLVGQWPLRRAAEVLWRSGLP
jgi:ABC-2 type transport system permease protein